MSRPKKNSDDTKKTVEKKVSTPTPSNVRFFILRPNKTRREWAIQAYTEPERKGKREYFKKDSEVFKELASSVSPINKQYKEKLIDDSTAREMLEQIISDYKKRQGALGVVLRGIKLSKANQDLLDKFWEKRYAHKTLQDSRSARADFSRALRLIGDISVYTSKPTDFRDQLNKNCKDVDQHRRAVSSLNEILKFVGRDFILSKPEEEYKEVRYLTEDEVKLLAESAPNRLFKLKTCTLFGTGCRTSEAYGIDPANLGPQAVHIVKQITGKKRKSDKAPKAKKPKRGKQGWVAVIKWTWKYVQEWAKSNDRSSIDRYEYYIWVTTQSKQLWPDDASKHIHPHDLRHSHAIYLLDKGLSIVAVARNLRNRVEICQKYYTGHEHTPDSLEDVRKKI